MKLYWRYKKNGKWTWKPYDPKLGYIPLGPGERKRSLVILPGEEEEEE